jgi:adenine-specific DNA-methyltransferase
MPTLDWIGKNAVVGHHKEVPYRLLKCDKEFSAGEAGEGNLLIEGDNLHALKALLPYYGGKVKCIYVDPPYNTGNESWIYNDNVNSPEIRRWLGHVVGKEAEDLSRHDKWLCMMYPRLVLLRQFLQEDGVAFISIDDNELTNLRLITEEIFGAGNVLATLVWEKGKKGDAKFFSVNHEYILVVVRNKAKLIELKTKWRRHKAGADKVLAHYAELRKKNDGKHDLIREEIMKWYRALPKDDPAKAHKHYNWSDDRGLYFADNFHGPDDGRENRPRYDISHPLTKNRAKNLQPAGDGKKLAPFKHRPKFRLESTLGQTRKQFPAARVTFSKLIQNRFQACFTKTVAPRLWKSKVFLAKVLSSFQKTRKSSRS